jgi:hypothetical protein
LDSKANPDNDRFDHLLRDVNILRKPFSREDLVERVRKLVDIATRPPFSHIGSEIQCQEPRLSLPNAIIGGPCSQTGSVPTPIS